MFTISHVVSLNVNKFDVLCYKMNRTFIAVFLVVEMLKIWIKEVMSFFIKRKYKKN